MSKITKEVSRTYECGCFNEHPILGATKIFEGMAVGINTDGYARPLIAGDKFAGFADRSVDNTLGTDGEHSVSVRHQGCIILSDINNVDQTKIGALVYASNENTFTLTETGNSPIGKISRAFNGEIAVKFEAFPIITEISTINGSETPQS